MNGNFLMTFFLKESSLVLSLLKSTFCCSGEEGKLAFGWYFLVFVKLSARLSGFFSITLN